MRPSRSLADVPQHHPGGDDGDGPQGKVHVHTAVFRKDGQGLQAVAEGLPRGLGAPQEGGVPDDL